MLDLFTSGPVRLHILRSEESSSDTTPVLFLPGFLETAGLYKDEIEFLKPHPAACFSFRGRGQSEILPPGNYSFEQQVQDISLVLKELNWSKVLLVAHSMAVPFAIQHTLLFPESVKALLIMDYPAGYRKPSPLWLQTVLKARPGKTSPEVIQALYDEAQDIPLWDRLPELTCPVQLVRGGTEGSLLSYPEGQTYMNLLKHGKEIVFHDSGHKLDQPNEERYFQMIREFVDCQL